MLDDELVPLQGAERTQMLFPVADPNNPDGLDEDGKPEKPIQVGGDISEERPPRPPRRGVITRVTPAPDEIRFGKRVSILEITVAWTPEN